jgi:hypothetical protein
MTEIKRYNLAPCEAGILQTYNPDGRWCTWDDVEALIKERDDLRNKALAAVWLLPEHTGIPELLNLREEAREVFMGKDKQTIAKLQDELRYAHEAYQHAVRPPRPGVNAVYGVKRGGTEYKDMRYALPLLSINPNGPNGGLEIEVQLP